MVYKYFIKLTAHYTNYKLQYTSYSLKKDESLLTFALHINEEMRTDISTRADIELLVNSFYEKVRQDETIGYIFRNIIGDDWSHHLPVMYQFWETVLLNKPGYTGNPIRKHIEVDKKETLQKEHYDRWLQLWNETADSLFEGPNASEIKNKAFLMMNLISMKVEWARLDKSIE